MFISSFVLCQNVAYNPQGWALIGVIEIIHLRAVPAKAPPFSLYAKLHADAGDESGNVKLTIVGPSGQKIEEKWLPAKLGGSDGNVGTDVQVRFQDLDIPEYGVYRFELRYGDAKARNLFEVRPLAG